MRLQIMLATTALLTPLARAALPPPPASFDADVNLNGDDTSDMGESRVATASASEAGGGSGWASASANAIKAATSVSGTDSFFARSIADLTTSSLTITSTVSTVDVNLNLVLNGKLATHSQDGSGSDSSVQILVNVDDNNSPNPSGFYASGRATYELNSIDGNTYINPGDSIPLTPTSSTDDTATFLNAAVPITLTGVPTNTNLDLSVQLIADSYYQDDSGATGTPADASATFGDTLQFAPTDVFTSLDPANEPILSVNAADVGIVLNSAPTSMPEPASLMMVLPGLCFPLLARRRPRTSR